MDESMETDQVYLDDTVDESDEEESQSILQMEPGGLILQPGYIDVVEEEVVAESETESDLDEVEPGGLILQPGYIGVVEEEVVAESETESDLEEEDQIVAIPRIPVALTVGRLQDVAPPTGTDRPRGPTPNESSQPESPDLLSEEETTDEETQWQLPPLNIGAGEPSRDPVVSASVPNLPVQSIQADAVGNSSVCEFKLPKKYKPKSPLKSAGAASGEAATEEQDDEAECCPICFERWTNSGSHRLASLKCGHLFGLSCIEKWLKGQGEKCPHCNAKAHKRDIRVIYAKALKTVDTSERDRALESLQSEKAARQKAELESAQSRLHYQSAVEECKKLQAELKRYKSSMATVMNNNRIDPSASTSGGIPAMGNPVNMQTGSFVLDRTVKISESGGCRVMAHCLQQGILCISQPSSSPLFPGFGVKKLSCLDFKTMQYVAVHSKPIRDIAFNASNPNGFMLTASMDKTVKVTSLTSNTVVQSYNCQMPVWSCCWNADDRNYFYAGQQNGTVLEFDMRNTTEAVQPINNQSCCSRSPVVSLQYVSRNPQATFSCGGVLVGQLDKCSFYEKKSADDYKVHVLPVEGSLTCLSLEETTNHILMTFRPNVRHLTVRHQMSALTCEPFAAGSDHMMCSCRHVHTFQGGSAQKLLSRNRLLAHPGQNGNLMVCGCDENSQSVHIWDATTGGLLQRLPSASPVMDLCPVNTGEEYYLVTLTEKQAMLHKWR